MPSETFLCFIPKVRFCFSREESSWLADVPFATICPTNTHFSFLLSEESPGYSSIFRSKFWKCLYSAFFKDVSLFRSRLCSGCLSVPCKARCPPLLYLVSSMIFPDSTEPRRRIIRLVCAGGSLIGTVTAQPANGLHNSSVCVSVAAESNRKPPLPSLLLELLHN